MITNFNTNFLIVGIVIGKISHFVSLSFCVIFILKKEKCSI